MGLNPTGFDRSKKAIGVAIADRNIRLTHLKTRRTEAAQTEKQEVERLLEVWKDLLDRLTAVSND